MKQRLLAFIVSVAVTCTATRAFVVPSADSLANEKELQEVTVTSSAANPTRSATIPTQTMSDSTLQRLSAHSVADALRYFSGLQIKDFGGVGGLKTVNVRALGTNHTGVFYDGVQLGNAQNGQIDLGRFSLDNMEAIQLCNGQRSSMLQTARDYASASAIYMQTRQPLFDKKSRSNLIASMKAGSFDTYNPSLLWEVKLSDAVAAQLSAEYLTTSGRYRFHYAKKNGYDTTEVRHNGDVRALRVETALFGQMQRGEWRAKIYAYDSERGLPGAAVRETPGRFVHQDRQWDTSIFGQGSWRKQLTSRYTLLLNAKVAHDRLHYRSDPRLDASTMYVDNHYRQSEAYASAANLFRISEMWTISLANDLQCNTLDADLTDFARPTRLTLLTALATSLNLPKFSAQASLLHTFADDHTRNIENSRSESRLTPTVALSWRALADESQKITLRAFHKQIFRLPTFNDLYYTFIGNVSLKPETARQTDIGFDYAMHTSGRWLREVHWQCDGYFNRVSNKIVAMPTSNQFRWTMLNYGLCHIWGAETTLRAMWNIGQCHIQTHATYTYTRAKDRTDRTSEFYNGQLPYIPWHSGSAIVGATWRNWSANYSFIYTGERYEQSANIAENYTKPWYTSDCSLSYEWQGASAKTRVTAEVNNVFNQQYEVVQCYPMPGTSFRVKVSVIL